MRIKIMWKYKLILMVVVMKEEMQYVKSVDEMFIGSEGQGDAS
jgi:hypothetical protein